MITTEQIPDEVFEAFQKAWAKRETLSTKECLAAALNAWPSALRLDGYEYGVQDVIHLPLSKEPSDD